MRPIQGRRDAHALRRPPRDGGRGGDGRGQAGHGAAGHSLDSSCTPGPLRRRPARACTPSTSEAARAAAASFASLSAERCQRVSALAAQDEERPLSSPREPAAGPTTRGAARRCCASLQHGAQQRAWGKRRAPARLGGGDSVRLRLRLRDQLHRRLRMRSRHLDGCGVARRLTNVEATRQYQHNKQGWKNRTKIRGKVCQTFTTRLVYRTPATRALPTRSAAGQAGRTSLVRRATMNPKKVPGLVILKQGGNSHSQRPRHAGCASRVMAPSAASSRSHASFRSSSEAAYDSRAVPGAPNASPGTSATLAACSR